jgi:Fe-S-cluster-containing hydrogenase component 2
LRAEARLVIHTALCDGCGLCVAACTRRWSKIDAASRLAVQQRGTELHLAVCRHCARPPCVEVCPEGALRRDGGARVVLDREACMGCQACVAACPFEAIFAGDALAVYKCNLCGAGSRPPCVTACASAALAWQTPEQVARQHRGSRAHNTLSAYRRT